MPTRTTKRELIINAAIVEFQNKGFESASMDRITERAGVSKRTVYNHFTSKAALFQEIINVMADRLKSGTPAEFSSEQPLRDQLLAMGEAKGRLLRSKQFMHLVRMAMSETLRDPETAQSLKQKSEPVGEFTQYFSDAIQSGSLVADDPKKVEEQFIGLIKAQAFWPAIFSGKVLSAKEMKRVIEESADTIIAAYGASE